MTGLDLATVFGAGVLTLTSPCVLPLIPIYLAMLLGSSLEAVRDAGGRTRLLTATLAFSLGFGLVFTALGLGASWLGQLLASHRQTLLWVGGLLVILFGLKFLGVIRLSFLNTERRFGALRTGHRLVDAGLFGVVFALGWTPCVGPILGSVLTYTASRTADPLTGALYLAVYSLGLATPLLVLGFASDRLLPLLQKLNRHLPRLEKITGVALVLLGIWLISTTSSVPTTDAAVAPAPSVADTGPVQPFLGEPSEKARMVKFYTPKCPACKAMVPALNELKQDCANHRIEILELDASDPRNQQAVKRYRVSVVPTLSLLAPDGREVRRLVGAKTLEELRQAAAALVEQTCATQLPLPLDALPEGGANCGEGQQTPGGECRG